MSNNPRCLYHNSFSGFISEPELSVLGALNDHFHGGVLTTTREAWKAEISIMKEIISQLAEEGQIIYEYDIPRLGKRIDVVLLYKGIIFCIEFKVGENLYETLKQFYSLDEDLDIKPGSVKYPFLIVYHGSLSIGDCAQAMLEIEEAFPEKTDVETWKCTDFSLIPEYLEIIDQILNKTEGNLIYESEDGAEDRLFFITKSMDNGTDKPVKELHCTVEEARQEFLKVVDEQCREYHIDKTLEYWRVIRLYDSKLNVLAQES